MKKQHAQYVEKLSIVILHSTDIYNVIILNQANLDFLATTRVVNPLTILLNSGNISGFMSKKIVPSFVISVPDRLKGICSSSLFLKIHSKNISPFYPDEVN